MKLKFHLKTKPHHHSEENKGRVRACKELWLRSRGTHHLFLFGYQHGSAVVQCFSLTTKQPQPAYKPQKQPAEQVMDMNGSCSLSLFFDHWMVPFR
jgi:hypothetical protein